MLWSSGKCTFLALHHHIERKAALWNFSIITANNKRRLTSISFCPPNSSKVHQRERKPGEHLLCPLINSSSVHLPLWTMGLTLRQLHTIIIKQTTCTHQLPLTPVISTQNIIMRFTGSGLMTRHFCSNKGKDSQSEKNNNLNEAASSSDPKISTIAIKDALKTRESVGDFLAHLSEDQKRLLYHSLNVDVLHDKYEGHSKSESHHYLSRFGRPTAAVDEDTQTGAFAEISPKWLHTRLVLVGDSSLKRRDADEKESTPPSASAVWAVGIKNALPFIGFGFLDNLIMILAGDYIDITIGTTLGISTMAAAALGNTISDVAGIGSAWYVEEFANKIGIKDPELTPSQLRYWSIRWANNGGRAIGVVIGCLLGMVPLLFLPTPDEKEERERKEKEKDAKAEAEKQASPKKDKN